MPVRENKHQLIGVIDDGTRTSRFVVYKSDDTRELCAHQIDKVLSTPQEGWSEQDPQEILQDIRLCVASVIEQLKALGYEKEDIITLGVTNQRETTIAWDKYTGEALHPAILWNDIRTDSTVDGILAKIPDRNKNYLKAISGLPISPYFSALKMRWLKDNVKAVRKACREKRCLFGTVDSWIIWNLTGGPDGGLHITDVTNASRTLLMNIETLHWDPMLCRLFSIHPEVLAEIKSSSEVYGKVADGSPLDGITISGILGNQQSALVGQMCFKKGQAKNTYRSGCFLLYNTGTTRVQSSHGLVTTVAYKMGKNEPTVYALEGSVAVAGGAMKWLRDNMRLIKDVSKDTENIAKEVFSTGDVYFVPAFSGLYAPYWRKDARGIICGLTAFTTKNHIIRAALEAVCFQTRDILEAMHKDCGFSLTKLHVDGKMTSNDLLMQLQADVIGIPVFRSHTWDMTALGAAIVAGKAVGAWNLAGQKQQAVPSDTFLPTTTDDERDARYTKWKMAVQRSLGWTATKKSISMTGQDSLTSKKLRTISFYLPHKSANDYQIFSASRRSSTGTRRWLNSSGVTFGDIVRNSPNGSECSNTKDSPNGEDEYISSKEAYNEYLRKFSLAITLQKNEKERSILDDIEYFVNKKECDYGMCQCCPIKVNLENSNQWETIEKIIECDPEIVFDSKNRPVIADSTVCFENDDYSKIDFCDSNLHLNEIPEDALPTKKRTFFNFATVKQLYDKAKERFRPSSS